MRKISFEDALILNAARTARFFVRVLPLWFSISVGRFIGAVLYRLTKRRHVARKNLRAAFAAEMTPSQMDRIARRSVENVAMLAVELLRFPEIDETYVRSHIRFRGLERLGPRLNEGKGLIFLAAHFGNWELLSVVSSLAGYPIVALARRQKHPRSDEFLTSLRSCKGGQVIRKGMPVREILKALKQGRMVGILSDQDAGKNGVFVDFFGRLSSMPEGAAAFSRRTGSPIFPIFMRRTGLLTHEVEVEEPIDLPAAVGADEDREKERLLLQRFAEVLEAKIRRTPDQWLWAHRRWKSTPDRFVLILSDGKAGHFNQSLAVFRAIEEERAARGIAPERLRLKTVDVRFQSVFAERFFKAFCWVTRGAIPFKRALLKAVLARECRREIERSYADIVISCGSSLAGINLAAAHENAAKSAVLMKPPLPPGRFDAVIVPKHDKMAPAGNIFVTERAPSAVSEALLRDEAEKLERRLDIPRAVRRIGLFLGGDTDRTRFEPALLKSCLDDLRRAALDGGAVVLATSSRRTPPWADGLLKEAFGDRSICPLLVIANEENPTGTLPGILGLSDVLAVSGESVSMVSEAVLSGKPVVVFTPAAKMDLKPKTREFLARLAGEKRIAPATVENLYETLSNEIKNLNGSAPAFLNDDKEVLKEAVKKLI